MPTGRRHPQEALIFDTETERGLGQRVRFLVWRLYRDAPGARPGHFCVEEGIAYPDDLPDRDPAAFEEIHGYAASAAASVSPGARTELRLESLSWWLQERLFAHGYRHRNRCLIVGFNLPFDLAAVASHWGEAKGYYRGGFSLGIWGAFDEDGVWRDLRFHPRLLFKAIDPRRTLFGWGWLKKEDADGKGAVNNFLDLRTLAFALTDRSYTLEGACAAFGDPYEKRPVDYDLMSAELLAYAREDVEHTALLYRHTIAELARHPGIELPPTRLYSPASVGVRYLEAKGVQRPLEKFTRLGAGELGWRKRKTARPPEEQIGEEILGYAMSAFYGGRAEARVIRLPVPVVHVDFTSMYPAVNSLLGTWNILRAAALRVVDAAEGVRELLADPELVERCVEPGTWQRIGVTLVELEPDGDILPVRAAYDPDGGVGIGINPFHYEGRLWYALPDVVAARLLQPNKAPRVVRALRLEGEGLQPGLRPVRLRGGIELDPTGDRDPFLTMIEQRQRVRTDPELSDEERERLQLFLKITANGTSYGSLARFDRRDLPDSTSVTVQSAGGEPRDQQLPTPEDPGPFCFPPIAASITAGARLMLALLERLVADAGGTYAFCDTDSMAIVAGKGAEKITYPTAEGEAELPVLGHAAVRAILGRFENLNPYDPELLRPWKVEHESLERPLWCYAISSKRYCLYRLGSEGEVEIVTAAEEEEEPSSEELADWSEHGLGAYVDPSGRPPEQQRDGAGRRIWIRETWEWIVGNALGRAVPQPAWAYRPALTRFTVSSPRLAAWFAGSEVRPGSFGLLAHADTAFYAGRSSEAEGQSDLALPAAHYEEDPDAWLELPWTDRSTGMPVRLVTPAMLKETGISGLSDGTSAIVIDTMGRVLGRYLRRSEHKSLAPDGTLAGPDTVGLLRRRPVTGRPARTRLIGKEGNQLLERASGQVANGAGVTNEYGWRSDPWEEVVERLKEIGAREVIEHTGFSRSAVYAVLAGVRPHPANRRRYEAVAAESRPGFQLELCGKRVMA